MENVNLDVNLIANPNPDLTIMVDLSVVIPVYNGEALLRRCLDSVVRQKTRYSFEIILVDDGSLDGTLAVAEEFQRENDTLRYDTADGLRYGCAYDNPDLNPDLNPDPNSNPNSNPNHNVNHNANFVGIRFLKQKNEGPAKARNWGMKEAQGRYIALLDADDYWEDSYVEKTVQFLDENPDCVAVNVVCKNVAVSGESYTPANYASLCYGCVYDNPDLDPNDNPNLDPNENINKKVNFFSNSYNKRGNAPFIIDKFYSFWAKWCHVGTCSTTMRAEVAKSILMREDLRISEDYEFWLMIAGRGAWGMIPEALYVSDGTAAIVSQEAWMNRMKRRWENAPALEDWESRIVATYPELKESESFRWAEGRVSRNLTYCQLLSGRDALARQEALKYGAYFVKDPIGNLMNLCKWTPLSWKMLCVFLRYREKHRFDI